MSVDVFGRKLGRSEGTRGAPGIGYKLTNYGHYDVENERLCNVAVAQQPSDAVNLTVLQQIVQEEVRSAYKTTARLESDIEH